MRRYVCDANALLNYIDNRPHGLRIAAMLKEAARADQPLLISAVNWGEVLYLLWRSYGEEYVERMGAGAKQLPLKIMPATDEDALTAARLKAVHKLPYADSFAAALALRERATLVTSDPDFEKLGKQLPILWLR
jgi:predicted nucleic acid-binding protein